MPRLWSETIAAHRRDVRDAIVEASAGLIAERGLRAVTMSQIANRTGIGRATLYRYFSDVDAVLIAWHERQIADHLEQLVELRDEPGDARTRLEAVLEAYAVIQHEHHGTELSAFLHQTPHAARAQRHLTDLVRDLLGEAREAGDVRDDVALDELSAYCLHALTAAGNLPSRAAVRRLVTVTLAGLHAR